MRTQVPTRKKMKPLFVGEDENVMDRTSAPALNTPPSAWPETTAVIYFAENCPEIPKILPLKIAENTKKKI